MLDGADGKKGEQGGVESGRDDGKGVAPASVRIGHVDHSLEVVGEGDRHGGVGAEAEVGDAHNAGGCEGGADEGEDGNW